MTEKQVERAIIRELTGIGCNVTKLSQPQRAMMTAGIPDLYVRHSAWGLRVWVEVKTPKGKVSLAQRVWHDFEREAGGTVLVVRSALDAVEQIAELRTQAAPRRDHD